MFETNERSRPRRRHSNGLALVALAMSLASASVAGLAVSRAAPPDDEQAYGVPVATFSIVAFDPETGDLGVAVQSKFFGVGSVVPWARAGIGAVATQGRANTTYGPRGLKLLAEGGSAEEIVAALTGEDEGRGRRQLGVVDAAGNAATFTGDACLPWAGGQVGEHYAIQGNILAGPEVVDAMAATFEATQGDLATRLAAALAAGQAAGGDARGRQSAALLVVREAGGYGQLNDRFVDLRVEDHPAPIVELRRLLDMRQGQLAGDVAAERLADGELAAALEHASRATTLYPNNGYAWLLLASVRMARGETEQAAAAGREALMRDPWLKTAVMSNVFGGRVRESVEPLLQIESFARLWEAIPVRW